MKYVCRYLHINRLLPKKTTVMDERQRIAGWTVTACLHTKGGFMNGYDKKREQSVRDTARKKLVSMILSGEFTDGQRLPPEREIANLLGISRGIASKCYLELAKMGLVRIVPRHGAYITDYKNQARFELMEELADYRSTRMDRQLFVSLMTARRVIESECFRLAASLATSVTAEHLLSLVNSAASCRNAPTFGKIFFEFHHSVALLSENIVFAMMIKSFEKTIVSFMNLSVEEEKDFDAYLDKYRGLCQSFAEKDGTECVKKLNDLFDFGMGKLSRVFNI